MEDLSTIIYIVIAVVAFVISSFGKKKKAAGKTYTPKSTTGSALENILRNQLPKEWLEESHEVDEAIHEKDILDIKASDEGSVTKPELKPILKYRKEKKGSKENSKVAAKGKKEKFDARKAIIYSTIMNKKYF
ncbi:MAG: hypothetical protein KAI79_03585 [Bacteroidales bacterium]|nr:hypothetical protein [Bacteroidales bacterium]